MSHFRTTELSEPEYENDGLRFLTVKTPNLAGRGDICFFVPRVPNGTTNLPIYILLHGVYGSAWAWAMKGGAHRTAKRLMDSGQIRPAVIAMPSDGLWGDGSAYSAHHGRRFDRWIVEDVPRAIRENVAATGPGSPLCLGGLSMGGYGALMLGLRFPTTFRAISGHSSITELAQMGQFAEEPLTDYRSYGIPDRVIDAVPPTPLSVPALRFDCGIEDELVEPNRQLHRQLTERKVAHEYHEFPGAHTWEYWRKHVEKSLRFFDRH